jgi:hypothetical protein
MNKIQMFMCGTYASMDFDTCPSFESLSDEDKNSWELAYNSSDEKLARVLVSNHVNSDIAKLLAISNLAE